MSELVQKIPTLVVLGALLAIFVALERQRRAVWVRMWLIGWICTFGHIVLELFLPTPYPVSFWTVLNLALWPAGAVLFLVSVSRVVEEPRQRNGLLFTLAAPTIVYAVLLGSGVTTWWLYAAVQVVIFGGGLGWGYRIYRRPTPFLVAVAAVILPLAAWTVREAWRGEYAFGFFIILTALKTFTAVLFLRRYRPLTPGVLAAAFGFATWAAVFPVAFFYKGVALEAISADPLWDVPRYLVAVGMIVILLEDESRAAQRATKRERALKAQMERFAGLTSRLLAGAELLPLCPEVAQAIVEQTAFSQTAILLADEAGKLVVAAEAHAAGETASPHERLARLSPAELTRLCAGAEPVGHGSCRLVGGMEEGAAGEELVIPLRSSRAAVLGGIWLRAPRGGAPLGAEDAAPLEMLASHMAASLDQVRLQRQLLVSEKLASLGQLVAGLTHELNNPLTAVLGYTELMLDRADEATRRDLTVVQREAGRIKRILQNLVRFAQTAGNDQLHVTVPELLSEVLSLREYEGRMRNVQIITDLPADLPRVPFDAELLKQVFFNLLNNALDAVEKSLEKRITIDARVAGERMVMQFSDTGPGFVDLTRVFDPFFTTREVGRGTGLGLSVCFGILKQHGGDIYARNLEPRGGCVVLELPLTARGISVVGHVTGKMGAVEKAN